MVRDKWTDIVALYKTYIGVIIPLLKESKGIIENFKLEDLYKPDLIQGVVEKITKRKVNKVKVITEFNAYFIQEIFRHIINYIDEIKDDLEPIDTRDYILEFLDESIDAFEIIIDLVVEDTRFHKKSLLYKLTSILSELIFPQGGTVEEIYTQLIEESANWYEVQRYILKPTTYYREKIDDLIIPGISPKLYQILVL